VELPRQASDPCANSRIELVICFRSLRGDLDQARQANAAAALKHLDATVRELVDVGRVLLPLAEVRGTLADSGRAGQAHALIDAAVRVHDRIRQRQYLLTTSNRYIAAMMARRFGIVRDVASLGPWATQLAAPGDTSWTDAPDLAEYVDGGGEPLFRLVCRDDLEAWVPTEPELTAASADMAKRLERARYRALHPGQNVETFEESDFTLSIDGKKAEPTARIHVETFGSRRA